MQKRTLEAALQNASVDDPVVADRLAYFGPALLKVCEVARRLPTAELPEQARIEEALIRPDRTLLADGPVAIDPAEFEEVVREFAVVLHDAAHAEGSLSDAMKAVDWTRFTTPDLVEVARTRPSDYFDRVEEAAEGDDLLSYYILPVLGFALRAHLDRFAAQASAAIDRTDDVTDHDRPLVCPVCGGLPDFASVHATPKNGNVKHLHCGTCGAHWKFERIRCAACGTSAVSDLSYVHDEADPARRLHVCKACGAATPTFFASGDAESFSPEVERLRLTGLEAAYEESRAQ
jgi:FdhE protein